MKYLKGTESFFNMLKTTNLYHGNREQQENIYLKYVVFISRIPNN